MVSLPAEWRHGILATEGRVAMRTWGILRGEGWGGLMDRLVIRRLYRRGPHLPERALPLRGGAFRFADAGELYAYVEVFVRHSYDRLPGFGPRDGWTIVDVGANIGCFSAYACLRMRRGTLLAMEPNPEAFRRQCEHLDPWRARRPGLRLVTACAAAGVTAGQATLTLPGGRSVRGTLDDPAEDGPSIPVRVRALDDWLGEEGIATVDLLKIDAEGSEVDVLRGAAATLRRTRRVVLEWHGPKRRDAVRDQLGGLGFVEAGGWSEPDGDVGMLYFRSPGPRS